MVVRVKHLASIETKRRLGLRGYDRRERHAIPTARM